MSTTKRSSIGLLIGGSVIMLVLVVLATWALMRFTLGP
jgi:flagellar biogenesis protein FliO